MGSEARRVESGTESRTYMNLAENACQIENRVSMPPYIPSFSHVLLIPAKFTAMRVNKASQQNRFDSLQEEPQQYL